MLMLMAFKVPAFLYPMGLIAPLLTPLPQVPIPSWKKL